ncbi:MAG: DUF6868 family protein [Hyphomicrobiales bacterium]
MMTLEQITSFLGWCTVINVAFLLFATAWLMLLRDWVAETHARMFSIPKEELRPIYIKYLAYFKIAVIVFNLTPYLALRIAT